MERLPTLRLCAMNSRTAVVRFIATRTGSKPIPLLCTACVIDTHPPHGSLSLITLLSVPPALFLWRPKGKVFFNDTVKSAASVSVVPLSVSLLLGSAAASSTNSQVVERRAGGAALRPNNERREREKPTPYAKLAKGVCRR